MEVKYINGDGKVFVLTPYRDHEHLAQGCRGCAFDAEGCSEAPSCTKPFNGQWQPKELDPLAPAALLDPPPEGLPVLLTEDPDHGDPTVPDALAYKPAHGGYPGMVETARIHDSVVLEPAGLARATDPETSHEAAAKVGGGKLIDLILAVMQNQPETDHTGRAGWTGKELAQFTGRALNSVTPRFAQLRRMGLIHPAGRRDKQIVWKLGNGVA